MRGQKDDEKSQTVEKGDSTEKRAGAEKSDRSEQDKKNKEDKSLEAVNPAPAGFKRTDAVTLPSLTFKDTKNLFVRFITPIEMSPPLPGAKSKKDVPIARVINLSTGELRTFVVPEVIRSELQKLGEDYYLNRDFEFIKSHREGKDYDDYEIHRGAIQPDAE